MSMTKGTPAYLQIDWLERRIAELEAALREQGERNGELIDNGQRLLEAADGWKLKAEMAENAALREDAERYRWVKSDLRCGNWMVMQWVPNLAKYERVKEEKIDDYIDAARKL